MRRVVAPVTTVNALLGALLAALTWQGTTAALAPQAGLDASWQAALAMATHHHLHFGTQIVWTYGPLGFLTTQQLYYPIPAILANLFQFGLATVTFWVLLSALRRHMTLLPALGVAYLAGYPIVAIWGGEEVVLPLVFVLTVRVLSRPDDAFSERWAWICFGSTAGLMILEKPAVGVAVCALAAIAVVCFPAGRRRTAGGLTLAAFGVVFAAGWFGTGNGLGNFTAYLRAVREAAAGYSAMAIDPPSGYGNNVMLAALLGVGIIAVSCLYARRLGRRAALGIIGASSLVTWVLFKEGFVRQDNHRLVFFASIPLIISAFVIGARPAGQPGTARSRSALVVAAMLGSALVAFAVVGAVPSGLLDPPASLRGFGATFRTLALPARRHHLVDQARASVRGQYGIPDAMITRIGRKTVDIDPNEQTVAWAYPDMRWDPLPTIQNYFAYTPALDQLDVHYIASSHAPQFILRQPRLSIDGRWPVFDAPSTQVAIYCNYREVDSNAAWQLLERTANRCGARREIDRVRVAFGKSVTVPKADRNHLVVASFDLHLPAWWPLVDAVYKPPQLRVPPGQVPRRQPLRARDRFGLACALAAGRAALQPALPAPGDPPVRTDVARRLARALQRDDHVLRDSRELSAAHAGRLRSSRARPGASGSRCGPDHPLHGAPHRRAA